MQGKSTWFALAFVFGLASASGAVAQGVEDDDARTLFSLGEGAYEQGRFQAALDYFQQAYDLSHRPQLLFNIGQAADRLREDRRALDAFEAYLREVPRAPNRRVVEARVVILRRALESATTTTPPATVPTTPPATAITTTTTTTTTAPAPTTEPAAQSVAPAPASSSAASSDSRTGPWIIAGASGGVLAVGVTFLALGVRDYRAVTGAADGSSWSSVEDAHDRASARITVGMILSGLGAAGTATGLALALRSDDAEGVAVRVHVLPNGLAVTGAF